MRLGRVPRVDLVVLTEKKQGNEWSEASRQVLNAARDSASYKRQRVRVAATCWFRLESGIHDWRRLQSAEAGALPGVANPHGGEKAAERNASVSVCVGAALACQGSAKRVIARKPRREDRDATCSCTQYKHSSRPQDFGSDC